MNPRSNLYLNAPYCYLTQAEGSSEFQLFVLVPVNRAWTVNFQSPAEQGSAVLIEGDLTRAPYTKGSFVKKKFTFSPSGTGVENVQVLVSDGNNQQWVTRLELNDSDNLSDTNWDADLAHHCPYLYLTGQRGNGNEPNVFAPYVLIPCKGYYLNREEVIISHEEDGLCSAKIALKRDDQLTDISYLIPPQINQITYREKQRDPATGDFRINISRISSPEDDYSDGTVRNKSSDM